MNKAQLNQYLAQHMPDSVECSVFRFEDGMYCAVLSTYRDGLLINEFMQSGWQRRNDAFVYSVGMLRQTCIPNGALHEPDDR